MLTVKGEGILDDLLRIFSDPVVLYPPAGVDILPNDLREEIQVERMLQRLKVPYPEKIDRATDAEALAYLMSASLEIPLNHDWYKIYTHLFGKYVEQRNLRIPESLEEIVAECKELDEYYASLLSDLETWLQEQKDKHYKDKQHTKTSTELPKEMLRVDFDHLLQDL